MVFGFSLLTPLSPVLLSLFTLGNQLNASNNSLGAAGATAFGEVLETNKMLTKIDVSNNGLGGLTAVLN